MIRGDGERTRGCLDCLDETATIVDPHFLGFGDREAAQNGVTPGIIIKRTRLMREAEDASVVDGLVGKLSAEQCLVEDQNIGIEFCDKSACSIPAAAID